MVLPSKKTRLEGGTERERPQGKERKRGRARSVQCECLAGSSVGSTGELMVTAIVMPSVLSMLLGSSRSSSSVMEP